MLTERIAATLIQLAREDVKARVPVYHAKNRRAVIYQRLNKLIPMPRARDPLLSELRAMYTSFYTLIFIYQDL